MPAELIAPQIHKRTRRIAFSGILLNKIGVFPVLYKTNILAVMLFRIDKPIFSGNITDFILACKIPQRKLRVL